MSRLLVAALLFIISSCATSSDLSYRYYGSQSRQSKSQSSVKVLFEKPTEKYESIADFQGRGSSDLIKKFQQKAAEIGADALIVTTSNEGYSYSTEWAGDGIAKSNKFEKFENRRIFATAIIYINSGSEK